MIDVFVFLKVIIGKIPLQYMQKVGHESDVVKTRPPKESPAKKRRKHEK